MNFAELCAEVGQVLSGDAINRIPRWVNWAVDDFNSRARWSHLEQTHAAISTVSTQEAYPLTGGSAVVAGFGGLIDVSIKTANFKKKLAYASPQVYDDRCSMAASGIPSIYTVIGGAEGITNLLLWPTPDATSGLAFIPRFYGSTVSAMDGDDDEPNVPEQYHQAIVFLASATGLLAADQETEGQVMQAKAEGIIQKALTTDIALRQGDGTAIMLVPKTPRAPGDPRDQNPGGGSAQDE